ncbi:caspase recruitment domain-containing protein 8-like [Thunnus thynnus]|uniref:caspase recruitment domain-containing protein 8-like n=1 Tax=Thunnus thynnus TaxID=8237 RepID=UPI003528A431
MGRQKRRIKCLFCSAGDEEGASEKEEENTSEEKENESDERSEELQWMNDTSHTEDTEVVVISAHGDIRVGSSLKTRSYIRTKRKTSCFSGAARVIRNALSSALNYKSSPRRVSQSSTLSRPPVATAACAPSFLPHPPPQIAHLQHDKSFRQSLPGDPNLSQETSFIHEALVEMTAPVIAESVPETLPTHSHLSPDWSRRDFSCLPCSHSVPSLSQITSTKNKNLTRAKSLPDMLLKDNFEEFTPDITVDENEETYRFHCSRPGLYQCSVTGLVFHMEGEGDVVYRIVSWNRRLLAQHHKTPAGPLFDIKCLQQSVCQLHLPHCEIRSTGGCEFLSVAHVDDEGIEFITPHQITETHVIINITGFSGFGNVKDEDCPPKPVRALVLLFYRPPTDPDPESLLNVLLLPRNVVLRDVKRMRNESADGRFIEWYIDICPNCTLFPKHKYRLSTSPEDDSVLVQPTVAEFDEEYYIDYFPSFQVKLKTIMKNIQLFLKDKNSSCCVWESQVSLQSTGVTKPQGQCARSLLSNERLKNIWTSFIDGISGPVLKSLLDKMFEKKVITDSERELADEMQNKRDKARFVIDTVTKKGEAASSEMIEFLCEEDPFLCKHLGLM